MTQEHVELMSLRPAARRRAGARPAPGAERHIVVATQDLPRMSAAIQELMAGGVMVTAYASPTRLLPRLHRWGAQSVSLLVIDGGASPAFARAAAIAARSTYPQLPIILLASAAAAENAGFMPSGVTVLRLPLANGALLATVARLLPGPADAWDDTPPDAA
jgi:hypothetical protein